MSKLKSLLLGITMGSIGFVQAQHTAIPDPDFEQFLIDLVYDDVIDGQVLTANINDIETLIINETDPIYPITDLTGIQDFASLEFLQINATSCPSIDFGDLINLVDLDLDFNNSLLTIDVSGCVNLEELNASDNGFTELDVSENTKLKKFFATNNNLSFLDVRNGFNEDIESFGALQNPNLECIFVDDAVYSATNWLNIDSTSTFVETEAACEALSIEEASLADVGVYPNPTNGIFQIDGNQEIVQLQIVSLAGKVVKSFRGNTKTFSVSDVSTGIYILSIETTLGTVKQRLIVQR